MAERIENVRYHALFPCDVIEAANWYDDRSCGLGDAFKSNVAVAVDAIIADPHRGCKTPLGLRYRKVARFPYLVLFDIANGELLLLGVLHTARSIEKWRETRT